MMSSLTTHLLPGVHLVSLVVTRIRIAPIRQSQLCMLKMDSVDEGREMGDYVQVLPAAGWTLH